MLTLCGVNITRIQILITLSFTVTDYKIQGAMFRTAVLDLQRGSKLDGIVLHKQFCSTYV